jgi:hypothetical protein
VARPTSPLCERREHVTEVTAAASNCSGGQGLGIGQANDIQPYRAGPDLGQAKVTRPNQFCKNFFVASAGV